MPHNAHKGGNRGEKPMLDKPKLHPASGKGHLKSPGAKAPPHCSK